MEWKATGWLPGERWGVAEPQVCPPPCWLVPVPHPMGPEALELPTPGAGRAGLGVSPTQMLALKLTGCKSPGQNDFVSFSHTPTYIRWGWTGSLGREGNQITGCPVPIPHKMWVETRVRRKRQNSPTVSKRAWLHDEGEQFSEEATPGETPTRVIKSWEKSHEYVKWRVIWGFLPANLGDFKRPALDPWVKRDQPGRGHGSPLQCSCLGNPMDRAAWWATGHGVTKSQTLNTCSRRRRLALSA